MHVVNIGSHEIFQALADPLRIRMMRLFAVTNDEACLCELSESLQEPEYKLSRHLKLVRQAGLLEASKEGRWVYHRLVKKVPFLEHLYRAIREIPDTDGEFGRDLARFKRRMPLRDNGRCRTPNNKAGIDVPRKSKAGR